MNPPLLVAGLVISLALLAAAPTALGQGNQGQGNQGQGNDGGQGNQGQGNQGQGNQGQGNQGGRPDNTPPPGATPTPTSTHRITICHSTGSQNSPYVKITVDSNSTEPQGHQNHENDLFLDGDVPCAAAPTATPAATATATAIPAAPTSTATALPPTASDGDPSPPPSPAPAAADGEPPPAPPPPPLPLPPPPPPVVSAVLGEVDEPGPVVEGVLRAGRGQDVAESATGAVGGEVVTEPAASGAPLADAEVVGSESLPSLGGIPLAEVERLPRGGGPFPLPAVGLIGLLLTAAGLALGQRRR